MTKDEALKLAHEALKKFHYAMIDAGVLDRQEVLNEGFTAATAIKEALAQQEQEPPVAFEYDEDNDPIGEVVGFIEGSNYIMVKVHDGKQVSLNDDLYDTPPQRTWVGLTNDELTDLFYNTNLGQQSAVAQAIALLKERNT